MMAHDLLNWIREDPIDAAIWGTAILAGAVIVSIMSGLAGPWLGFVFELLFWTVGLFVLAAFVAWLLFYKFDDLKDIMLGPVVDTPIVPERPSDEPVADEREARRAALDPETIETLQAGRLSDDDVRRLAPTIMRRPSRVPAKKARQHVTQLAAPAARVDPNPAPVADRPDGESALPPQLLHFWRLQGRRGGSQRQTEWATYSLKEMGVPWAAAYKSDEHRQLLAKTLESVDIDT